jgi:predicted O-methyltransferase YrrM
MIKPQVILETGTHLGYSASYMGLALEENDRGLLVSLEVQPDYAILAKALFDNLKLQDRVSCILQASLDYVLPEDSLVDFLFLDSEPEFRFDEFVRFWPQVRPGGFIGIHDLHPHLGHSGVVTDGMMDRPYGDFRPKLGPMILQHEVQTVTFPTPRGFTLFQKSAPDFGATNLLCGKL